MPKNYSQSYYLEAPDIAQLIETYHQAYLEKYPDHFLSQLDPRFWLNESGELIFYAGEQALVDTNTEANIQPLGRGLYDATLTLAARFLELDLAELPSENLHIFSLINLDRGHWTSVVLSIEELNEEKYQAIYKIYQQFKNYLKDKHPDFVMARDIERQSCTNLFVQYATGNRFGSVVGIQNKTEIDLLICEFFESIGKKELLEIKQKEGEARYLEGNLELVLTSKNPSGTNLLHFDSLPSSNTEARVKNACERFLEVNQAKIMYAKNLMKQTGATCGEHGILNPLRYLFLRLTNVAPSSDLRTATNHFCVDFAKLFLFDYNEITYKQNFAQILNAQKLEGQEEAKKNPLIQLELGESTSPDKKAKIKKIDTGEFLANGIYIGIGLTLGSVYILAPILGIANPILAGLFSAAVGLGSAQIVKAFAPEVDEAIAEIKSGNIFTPKSDKVDEADLLEALSKKAFDKEYPSVPNKTFTPLLLSVTNVAQTAITVTPTLAVENKLTDNVERKGMKID